MMSVLDGQPPQRRKALFAVLNRTFREMTPGAFVIFNLPGEQTAKRDAYLRINGAAYRVFGAGGYRIKADHKSVMIRRRALDDVEDRARDGV